MGRNRQNSAQAAQKQTACASSSSPQPSKWGHVPWKTARRHESTARHGINTIHACARAKHAHTHHRQHTIAQSGPHKVLSTSPCPSSPGQACMQAWYLPSPLACYIPSPLFSGGKPAPKQTCPVPESGARWGARERESGAAAIEIGDRENRAALQQAPATPHAHTRAYAH